MIPEQNQHSYEFPQLLAASVFNMAGFAGSFRYFVVLKFFLDSK
jgi:hypothetical protein